MSDSLILTLTDAGRLALLSQVDNGFNLTLVSVKLGSANYKASADALGLKMVWAEFPLLSGFVDTDKQCLSFSAAGQVDSEVKISEIGLFNDKGVLIAVASKETGCFFTTEKSVFFSFEFSVGFDQKIDGSKVNLSFRPQDTILKAMLALHLKNKDPHPIYKRFVEELFKQHLSESNPHTQYALMVDFLATLQTYYVQLDNLLNLLSLFFEKNIFTSVAMVNNTAAILLDSDFRSALTELRHAILITPEAGHEAWSISRGAQSFNVEVFNRSGTNRVGYGGRVSWLVIDGDLTNPMANLDMPEMIAAGVRASSGGLTVDKPGDKVIDLLKCVFLMTPEGGHEAWEISRTKNNITANIFNRSGKNRVGYNGNVSYAILDKRDGKGADPVQFPALLMSGVSETGTFEIVRPNGKKWDFSTENYAVIITPEGGHEAWDIGRSSDRISVNVFNRSGTSRVGYGGKVSWAIFQKEGDFDLYRAGTYEIVIPARSKIEIHLVGAGGSGAGSLWASNLSANWLKMAKGSDTSFTIAGQLELIAQGGEGGYRGVWNNGSAYIQGVAGLGGVPKINKLGAAKIIAQNDGRKAYLETAHDWCNRDTRGGLSVYRFGQGGEGGYTVETRKHRCYGAGGGSGSHIYFSYENTSSQAIKAKLVVGNFGAPDNIAPELNNGKSGEAGCATIRTTLL